MSKRKLNRRQQWRVEKIQKERASRVSRKDNEIDEKLSAGELGVEQEGQIIAHYGRQVDVESMPSMETESRPSAEGEPASDDPVNSTTRTKGKVNRCYMRANIDALVTGDKVVWRSGPDGDGIVVARLDRKNALMRPDTRGQLKPVAANIDYIVIVFAPEPYAHANLIDRYIVAAENTGIEPVLLLNKTDLLNADNAPRLLEMAERYQAIGYKVLTASTVDDDGLSVLQSLLDNRVSVFVGQSGVGKSSLVNTLLPGINLRVGELSEQTRKGMHTTTTAMLFHLPNGGDLIDSPGIREFGLWHIDERQVAEGFREFDGLLGACKFRDCSHRQEPGCALREGLEAGKISPERFDSYHRIIASLDEF
ncbi:small ribosomal subunit biogenesis GTPase RsgA [Oceanospirillum maris]|uniref:small ribosomal subunit biogenesis GTPase RsgA n=1 Tax=Oceanospirillum maris TaxID=64977 RepID=UPI00040DEE1C|nr:small ribosomal subunit biogenesis GTPase RsgA [Oceanospirillum maris]